MKGPRKREASQPAYDFRFRHPSGALEDGARGWDFFRVSLYVLGIQSKCYIKIKAKINRYIKFVLTVPCDLK